MREWIICMYSSCQKTWKPVVAILPVEFMSVWIPELALKKYRAIISGWLGENWIQVAAKHCPWLYPRLSLNNYPALKWWYWPVRCFLLWMRSSPPNKLFDIRFICRICSIVYYIRATGRIHKFCDCGKTSGRCACSQRFGGFATNFVIIHFQRFGWQDKGTSRSYYASQPSHQYRHQLPCPQRMKPRLSEWLILLSEFILWFGGGL